MHSVIYNVPSPFYFLTETELATDHTWVSHTNAIYFSDKWKL